MPTSYYMLDDSADIDPRIRKLFAYGHFANPDHPTEVKQSDLPKLKLKDKVVKQAVQSYQVYFSEDLHHVAKQVHGRLAETDGEWGPATAIILDAPRCGAPDFAREEARWPDSCVSNLSISYFFDQINATVALQAWQTALKAWSDTIEMGFDLRATFSRNTHVWATDSALSGSILAWSMLSTGTCNQNAEQRYNTRTNWSADFLARTILHELGHAWGMGHINSRQAVMNPSITDNRVPQPLDIALMLRLGYKKRTSPPPPPPPGPNGLWTGAIKMGDKQITLIGLEAAA